MKERSHVVFIKEHHLKDERVESDMANIHPATHWL